MAKHLLYCGTCSLPFVTEYSGASSCLPCWKKAQGYDLSKADHAHIMLQEKLNELLGSRPSTVRVTKGALSNKDIKRLLRLCHPDKHDNSALSTEVTKMLNDMRG